MEEKNELDRYERIVDRAHKEIEWVRSAYKWLTVLITLLIIAGAWITYDSFQEMRADFEQQFDKLSNMVNVRIETEFQQPTITAIVQGAAAKQAAVLMSDRIGPEVAKFKDEVAEQLKELYSLVATTEELKAKSEKHEKSIQAIRVPLQHILEQSQNQLSTFMSDIVQMQKHLATIQYYQIKGANRFPNPYKKEMTDALNKLVAISIPNTAERNKFITELQGPQEPR